jgi:superfamily II DNA or RNA helicase
VRIFLAQEIKVFQVPLMKYQTREYQQQAVYQAVASLEKDGTSLWQMPTGSGKAYSIALLINEMLDKTRRILVLVDQTNLVEQLYGTIALTCRSVMVGVACKGLSKYIDAGARVIIASRQTLSANPNVLYSGFDFIILDEAHEVKPMRVEDGKVVGDGQYYDIIKTIEDNAKGNLRLHGCTATPWRLNDGYIYGHHHSKAGNVNYFGDLTYKVSYAEMIAGGYIVPPVYHREERYIDRESIKVDPLTGEYDERSVSAIMRAKIGESVWLWKKYLADAQYSAAFCCDIQHCEEICGALKEQGITAYAMHSKIKEDVLQAYKQTGGCLVTVDQATKGFDFPPLSAILMLRPTNASVVCYQQIGRPLRASPGKACAIIVDPCGNTAEHMYNNDLDRPVVPLKRRTCLGRDGDDKPVTFKRLAPARRSKDGEAQKEEKAVGMATFGHASTAKAVSIDAATMQFIPHSGLHGDAHWLRGKTTGGRTYNIQLFFMADSQNAEGLRKTEAACKMLGIDRAISADDFALKIAAARCSIASMEIIINNRDITITKVHRHAGLRD